MALDPNVIVDLGAKLAAAMARNTAGAIFTRIAAVKARHDDKATIAEQDEIIRALIDDRGEALDIAQSYEQELGAQRISDDEIDFIVDTIIPALKTVITQMRNTDPAAASRAEAGINAIEPVLSKEMLTVLQLIGFNYKRAIGEPLTLVVQKYVENLFPANRSAAGGQQRNAPPQGRGR